MRSAGKPLPLITNDNMKKLALITLLAFVFTGAFAQSARTESEVWSSVEALTKAIFETKDSVVLSGLVASDVSYAHSSGVVENKKEMVQAAITSPTKYKNLEIEKGTISIQGNTALLRHNLRAISVAADGTESPLNLGILQVWRKEGGKWKIWGRQAVRIPAKG